MVSPIGLGEEQWNATVDDESVRVEERSGHSSRLLVASTGTSSIGSRLMAKASNHVGDVNTKMSNTFYLTSQQCLSVI